MAKPSRTGKLWTKEEIKTLRDLARVKTPASEIAIKLHRSAEAVRSKARDEHISLAPRFKQTGKPKKK